MTPLFAIYDYIFGKTNESIPSMREHDMEQSTLNQASDKPTVTIYYCRQCNWMLRASWLSQELLHTFSEELGAVTLCPDTGGRFEIFCNGVQIWDRKAEGGFPEAKILKQRVRNIIAPERDLGHVDSK
jgi:selenoprotein W-related protein|tara:strand:+ start:899 stop:1282 length:384 start_codon:yes stop_codon:yes gene_type:complete